MEGLDARAVAELLSRQCDRLFTELVPDARPEGAELRGHGPDGAVWSMVVRGDKRGVWADWADPEHIRGDCLELVHHALFPGETARGFSYRWALRWLGLGSPGAAPEDADRRALRAQVEQTRLERVQEAARKAQKAATRARAIYLAGRPHAPEIVSYLRDGRGLPIAPDAWPLRDLRFNPDVYYDAGELLPAMVAAIVHPVSRAFLAVHCTFLEWRAGAWRNLADGLRRKVLGPKRGGVIKLDRGASRKQWPPPGETLLIGEGIENSIAAGLCCPEAEGVPDQPRIWAAVDIGNFGAIELPPEIASVVLVHDRDNERFGTLRQRLAEGWIKEGRMVWNLEPPRGFKDFNAYVSRLVVERHV